MYSTVELVDERRRQRDSSYAQRARSRPGLQQDIQQLSLRLDLNEAIGMDFMIMPDMDNDMHAVLVIVDIASAFTAAIHAGVTWIKSDRRVG
eukprot:9431038-Pyramimonas_sp.AAC.1